MMVVILFNTSHQGVEVYEVVPAKKVSEIFSHSHISHPIIIESLWNLRVISKKNYLLETRISRDRIWGENLNLFWRTKKN
jgi:hypothetical protein